MTSLRNMLAVVLLLFSASQIYSKGHKHDKGKRYKKEEKKEHGRRGRRGHRRSRKDKKDYCKDIRKSAEKKDFDTIKDQIKEKQEYLEKKREHLDKKEKLLHDIKNAANDEDDQAIIDLLDKHDEKWKSKKDWKGKKHSKKDKDIKKIK